MERAYGMYNQSRTKPSTASMTRAKTELLVQPIHPIFHEVTSILIIKGQ
jgi:hypothetical protein